MSLLLDELSEFARATLDALRQPLEEGRVAIVRARHSAVYPARFVLVAATNPCPCGYAGEHERCRCSEAAIARHHRRLSGPLLDRIDLLVSMERSSSASLAAAPSTTSAATREQVIAARELQARRLAEDGILVNAHMDARMLRKHLSLERGCEALLADTQREGMLSARGAHRALRVARTVADLAASPRVSANHLAEALSLRPEACMSWRRAA